MTVTRTAQGTNKYMWLMCEAHTFTLFYAMETDHRQCLHMYFHTASRVDHKGTNTYVGFSRVCTLHNQPKENTATYVCTYVIERISHTGHMAHLIVLPVD